MRVLVIGDVIIDSYTYGKKLGLSAETPTIVAEYGRNERFAGGAALVARKLLRLGASVDLLTVGPEFSSVVSDLMLGSADSPSPKEFASLKEHTLWGTDWKFTCKWRLFVDEYKLLQYDTINRGEYGYDLKKKMEERISHLVDSADAVVICDNRHGVLTEEIADHIVFSCEEKKKRLYVDSQVSQHSPNHEWYLGCTSLLLNEKECRSLMSQGWCRDLSAEKQAQAVAVEWNCEVLLKLGAQGAVYIPPPSPDAKIVKYPAINVEAIDTCGAGDAFLAAYVYSRDVAFANRWAGLSTTYKGTIVPKKEDLDGAAAT